jgi:hypothetical protein
MTDCRVCGAPAEVEQLTYMAGVDFDGRDAWFPVYRILCAAGHRYSWIDDQGVVK